MKKLNGKQIENVAFKIIAQNPGGISTGHLYDAVIKDGPETPRNTVHNSIHDLAIRFPDKVTKPSRGVFAPASPNTESTLPAKFPKEVLFYDYFAEYLKENLEEVVQATPVGKAFGKKKWSNPDVVGVYRRTDELIGFPLEIVAIEIKTDPTQAVVAFGQAIAYRLFAAKTYIAMPKTLPENDKGRLEDLCLLFGVGFLLFGDNPKEPQVEIRARAQKISTDIFYVNEFAVGLQQHDVAKFELLFGKALPSLS